MNKNAVNFPALLRQERIRQGLTQKLVCLGADFRPSQLSQWESGHIEPSLGSLIQWADALGFNVVLEKQ
jgi:transcriptional regulator with XRE-family HTH domain